MSLQNVMTEFENYKVKQQQKIDSVVKEQKKEFFDALLKYGKKVNYQRLFDCIITIVLSVVINQLISRG